VVDHAEYDRIEEELNDALAVSLDPRSPDVLFDVIAQLGLPAGATAIDVGCGRGGQSLELARRFGFDVRGVDPLERYGSARAEEAQSRGSTAGRVSFETGTAEGLPIETAAADLVLYREMLYLVDDLEVAFAEGRRVLKRTGRAVVYQLFNTDWLEPGERERFWQPLSSAQNADPEHFEQAAARAGFAVEQMIDLGGETVEWAEEQNGKAARELLAASRLIRHPAEYHERFGRDACDIKLTDAFWFIYRMIGKLSQRVYVLRPI
jgi:ubiquinone/menaquinone biosynthesis C-methylase UbiE